MIIKLGAMGDALRSKCLLSGLKKKFPESWITWLTQKGTESIVRDPLVNEIRIMDAEGILALEGRTFDHLICLDKDPSAISLSKKLNALKRYGYAPTKYNTVTVWNEGSHHALRLGLSDDLKYYQNTKTHQQILYDVAELDYQGQEYELTVSPDDLQNAESIFKRIGLNHQGNKIVGLNTGCGPVFETKAWTREGFSKTARALAQMDGVKVLLLGGPREREINQAILSDVQSLVGTEVFDGGTDNSLTTFFGLVNFCDALVSTDSLAMHVGIALKKEVVAFFGPTCEQEIDLFGRGEKLVTDYNCSPCYLKRCDVRPSCMQALKSETVVAAVQRSLDRISQRDKSFANG